MRTTAKIIRIIATVITDNPIAIEPSANSTPRQNGIAMRSRPSARVKARGNRSVRVAKLGLVCRCEQAAGAALGDGVARRPHALRCGDFQCDPWGGAMRRPGIADGLGDRAVACIREVSRR